jgi:hypothetical protein
METKSKEEILKQGTEMCGKLLIGLMSELEIPNYIESTILDVKDNQKYRLRIEKITKKSLLERIRSYFL